MMSMQYRSSSTMRPSPRIWPSMRLSLFKHLSFVSFCMTHLYHQEVSRATLQDMTEQFRVLLRGQKRSRHLREVRLTYTPRGYIYEGERRKRCRQRVPWTQTPIAIIVIIQDEGPPTNPAIPPSIPSAA